MTTPTPNAFTLAAALAALVAVTAAAVLTAGRSWSRNADGGPPDAAAGVPTLPESRGGQDVVGSHLPDLEFDRRIDAEDDADDKAGDGNADAGRVTLYRWWTDGCQFCEKSLPAVEALRRKYGPRGLRTVAVYHPKPPREVDGETIRAAADRLGYRGAVAVDLDWSELRRFYLSTGKRRATSASFLVDGRGVIRFAHPGPDFFPSDDPDEARQDGDYRLIEQAIEALLAEKPES